MAFGTKKNKDKVASITEKRRLAELREGGTAAQQNPNYVPNAGDPRPNKGQKTGR